MQQRQVQKWLKAMSRGQKAFQRGKLMEARTHYRAAVNVVPDRPEGWVNLGVVQMEAGRFAEALTAIRRAVQLDSKLAQAQLALGDLLRLQGDWQRAIAAYREALASARSPEGMNKLACALRVVGELDEAESLYREALRASPEFSLARVNLVGVTAELGRLDEAEHLLHTAERLDLGVVEREELGSIRLALADYKRIQPALEIALRKLDPYVLCDVLAAGCQPQPAEDESVLEGIRNFARAAREIAVGSISEVIPLPDDWPLIEALFVIPYIESVGAYRDLSERLSRIATSDRALLESLDMEGVVVAARSARGELGDPLKAEMHLRFWHSLAARNLPKVNPGQFKLTENRVIGYEQRHYTRPHLVAGTLRHYFREIYPTLPPGVARGLTTMKAIFDIHPFADGNGRLALVALNRELEWAGQMPVLFPRAQGLTGKSRAQATRDLPMEADAIPDLLTVVKSGQRFAHDFCTQLSL